MYYLNGACFKFGALNLLLESRIVKGDLRVQNTFFFIFTFLILLLQLHVTISTELETISLKIEKRIFNIVNGVVYEGQHVFEKQI